jgi:CHAD domain-containing protein
MPYRIRKGNAIGKELARAAREQIDRAIAEIDDASLDAETTIHQVRKRCKKVRAVLRLVREPLEEGGFYSHENARFRDAARRLSKVRDAAVMIDTYDSLLDYFADEIDRRKFAPVRRALTLTKQDVHLEKVHADDALGCVAEELRAGRAAVDGWAARIDGFESLEGGLRKTYSRARSAMHTAYEDSSGENFHEWRKRVKYHRYHCRLLNDLWPALLGARREEANRLGGLLGDEHDLSVFRACLATNEYDVGSESTREALVAMADRRRDQLREAAAPLGRRLYVEKPKRFLNVMRCYWEAN